ncbi:MAG: DinB family protein [Phototrophicaceae bacterium]|jgi:uncharacterized damage-inducible protein DinB
MNAAAIRVLFDYHAWANALVWKCVAGLSPDQFIQPFDDPYGSVRDQLVYQISEDARWLKRLSGLPVPLVFVPADFADVEAVSRLWSVVTADCDLMLDTLQDGQVSDAVSFLDDDGNTRLLPGWTLLLHVLNHGTDQRAQVLYKLHRLGVKTPEQDFVYYLRDELPPRGFISVSAGILRQLIHYDVYATTTLVSECLSALDEGELDQDLGYSHRTLRAQLAHILVGGRYWLERVTGAGIGGDPQSVFAELTAYAETITDAALMEPVEYKNPHGVSYANIRWELLWHLVNHGTDHRAQCLAMLDQLYAPTFDQSLMGYLSQ